MSMYYFDVLCMKLKNPIDSNSLIPTLSKVWGSQVSSTLAVHRIKGDRSRGQRARGKSLGMVKGNGQNNEELDQNPGEGGALFLFLG